MVMGAEDAVKPFPAAWLALFSRYHIGVFRGDEVIRGTLRGGLDVDSPDVAALLTRWDGPTYDWRDEDGVELILVRPTAPPERPRWIVYISLFVATMFTTLTAGALLLGRDPLDTSFIELGPIWLPVPTTLNLGDLLIGAPFALTLLGILLAHELGHYCAALHHRIRVSPPFFIPFPPYFSIVGTLGAFIRLKGPIVRRSILLDIGAAGPLIGFALSLPASLLGLAWSERLPSQADPITPYVIQFFGEPFRLGDGVLFRALATVTLGNVGAGNTILLHPVAFAGWLGLFITALNLLPLGQLDGGHILYALSGRRQRIFAIAFLLAVLPLGLLWWGWWFWIVATVALSRGRIGHPPVLQERAELDPPRRLVAWITILICFLTFTPIPLDI